ncbi:MAG: threonylcarbamoyl-AMP synthase [Hyphomicrobiales bacterium]|nr:MAG: threonylcarbamoyl-AMP synthase [Hyphomicrobiales bacterium]
MQIWQPEKDDQIAFKSDEFQKIVKYMQNGGIVAVPTETVYGLAADATNAQAVASIFQAKGRPAFNPLISHVDSIESALKHGIFNASASALANAFWPGPLTLVVPRHAESSIAGLTCAGLSSVALRVPRSRMMRQLSRVLGVPLAAPSANRSGKISPTNAKHVLVELGDKISLIIDDGYCSLGLESTVVACTEDIAVLLRPGGITKNQIEHVLEYQIGSAGDDNNKPQSPGMLTSHYAPECPVRLNITEVCPGEALLAFGLPLPAGHQQAFAVEQLSQTRQLNEAAQNLFTSLRRLGDINPAGIAVMPIPQEGLGLAIQDRLTRAAAPRTG